MWLRPGHKFNIYQGSIWLLSILGLLFFSACSPAGSPQADKLNAQSYACHYRDLSLLKQYCEAAARPVDGRLLSGQQEAERRNNEAFYLIAKMEYDAAARCLNTIPDLTDNQIELLICYVQQMRLCQRRSLNKDFYDCHELAAGCLKRIGEERHLLDDTQQSRLLYGETEYAIVSSTYYYYIGLERQSIEALHEIDPDEVKRDTAQFLNYLYNIGAGGIITDGTRQDISRQEFEYLLRCYQIASLHDYPYFTANAMEAMAEHLIDGETCRQLAEDHAPGLKLVNPENVSLDDLPVWLAEHSLQLFRQFGDVYQTAGAYRTLSSCYRARGDFGRALENLHLALSDSLILQAPDLVASIYEQLSVTYAAVNDKPASDHYRNLYLDLQEQTRQDRQLEARADQLEQAVRRQNIILVAILASVLLLLAMFAVLRRIGRTRKPDSTLDDQLEERREQLAVRQLHIEENERRNLDQRAKISLVNSLLPLIDRMAHEVQRVSESTSQADERIAYIRELTEKIEADNEVLTRWIQLRQGQLNLRVESFPLQPLLELVARSRKSFQMKGVTLEVVPTSSVVKADRILTLFMLNTLADNARKYTESGGVVSISATEGPDYVEISVRDTGIGMDEKRLAHVFEHQLTPDDVTTVSAGQPSHGFGLLNCKGIIEKYRKMSQIFSVCLLDAESRKGEGSRFFFRLPKGIVRLCVLIAVGASSLNALGSHYLSTAKAYADSAYFSNINGSYAETLRYGDSCCAYLNRQYLEAVPGGEALMTAVGGSSVTPSEIQWLRDSVPTNYSIILDIRNESAVASLALHDWDRYQYNNRIYTQLFRELSADATLADYCRKMQQTRTNLTIAVVLLVLLAIALLAAYYLYILRPRLSARFLAERSRMDELEALDDELRRTELEMERLHVSNAVLDNCLSALKHETMYYPSRIRQLLDQNDMAAVGEVVNYYRDLYNLLSGQAQDQVERMKLHLRPLEHGILGDATLVRYLFDILKRQSGQKTLDVAYRPYGDKYIEAVCHLPAGQPPFSAIDQYLCRQILRDHGEATNRRACSIREEQDENGTTRIIMILPAYGKL